MLKRLALTRETIIFNSLTRLDRSMNDVLGLTRPKKENCTVRHNMETPDSFIYKESGVL